MNCRNLNYGRRNPRIQVRFRGCPAHSEKIGGPTVHLLIGSAPFGDYRIGFHTDLNSARKLLAELTQAIKDAKPHDPRRIETRPHDRAGQ